MNLLEKIKSILKMRYAQYVAGFVIFSLLIWLAFKPKTISAELAVVKRGTFVQFIEEEGISRVKEKFRLFSPVNGVLNRVEKNAGDTVKEDEVVAIVDWDFKRKILSPIAGTILQIYRESAGPIAMGNPIMDIGDTMNQEIVSEVLTQEAVKIKPNDLVSLEGWGGSPLEGTVRRIEPEAFKKISSLGVEEQRVKVLIDFKTPLNMGEGFKVICNIQTSKEENKLLVPTSSLFREDEDWAVFKVVNGKAKKTILKIEARSGTFASVSSGIQENDEVILFPGEGIKENSKVK